MLAIGIKNAIIFLLAILCLHIILKSILIDKTLPPLPAKQKYFENYVEPIKEPIKENKIDEKSKMISFIEENTCNADIEEKKIEAPPMQVKADCHLLQEHKNFMIIKEYDNEKGINGGKLYDGLDAYDTFDDYFQTYNSSY